MAGTMQLYRGVTRRLVMSGGDIGGGQFLGAHGIHKRMYSTRGTHNYNEDSNYKAPEQYDEQYCYKPSHYNEDYNKSSNAYSSRDMYFKNISEKQIPTKMEYDIEKLKYRIFRIEHNIGKHYEKFHRALQKSVDEIRDDRKKVILDINMEKLTNELNTVIHYNMENLTNDLIQICAKYMAKPKADLDDRDPPVLCGENVEESELGVDDNDRTTRD